MDAQQVAQEIKEELRTNGALRRRLGMSEGDETAKVDTNDDNQIVTITTSEGQTFMLAVADVSDAV